jgi:hypothetical protein
LPHTHTVSRGSWEASNHSRAVLVSGVTLVHPLVEIESSWVNGVKCFS